MRPVDKTRVVIDELTKIYREYGVYLKVDEDGNIEIRDVVNGDDDKFIEYLEFSKRDGYMSGPLQWWMFEEEE